MDAAEFIVVEDGKEYSIAWQIFSKDSEMGRKFDVQGDISLPFFVSNEDAGRIRRKEGINVTEFNLAVGLLLRYFGTPPLTVTHKIKPYFRDVLRWASQNCANASGLKSTEKFISYIANNVSVEYGRLAGYNAFKAALEILPDNPRILKRMRVLASLLEAGYE